MLDLSLDTSTDRYLIVLSEKKTILGSIDIPHEHNLSQSLVPSIQKILIEKARTIKDISRIFIGIGPGSYTGTRIAVAVAEGLGLALNISLHPFCSLLAFIPQNIPEGPFTFLFDTKHDSHFLLKGIIKQNKVVQGTDQFIIKETDASSHLKSTTLICFNPNKLPEFILKEKDDDTLLLEADINIPFLITYLNDHKQEPPPKPDIIYLHTF